MSSCEEGEKIHQAPTQRQVETPSEYQLSSRTPCHQSGSDISEMSKEVDNAEARVNLTSNDVQKEPEEVDQLTQDIVNTLEEFGVGDPLPPSYVELELACDRLDPCQRNRFYRPRPPQLDSRMLARNHLRAARVALFDLIPCTHPLMARIRWDGFLEDSPSDYGIWTTVVAEDRSSDHGSRRDIPVEADPFDDDEDDWNDDSWDNGSSDEKDPKDASSKDNPMEEDDYSPEDFSPELGRWVNPRQSLQEDASDTEAKSNDAVKRAEAISAVNQMAAEHFEAVELAKAASDDDSGISKKDD